MLFQWAAKAQRQPAFERPLGFYNPLAVLIINLLWLSLLIGGFYSLWQVNPIIVLILIGICPILWIIGYILGSEKGKAKKIFKIYKKLKISKPKAKEEELFKETATIYYNGLRWDEDRIQKIIDLILKKRDDKKEKQDIKNIANSILIFESPHNNFGATFNFKKHMKKYDKREKAIETAHKTIMGKTKK